MKEKKREKIDLNKKKHIKIVSVVLTLCIIFNCSINNEIIALSLNSGTFREATISRVFSNTIETLDDDGDQSDQGDEQSDLPININVLYNGEEYGKDSLISVLDESMIEITVVIPANYGVDSLRLNIPQAFVLENNEPINGVYEFNVDEDIENVFNFNVYVDVDEVEFWELISTIEISYLKDDSILD